MSEHRPWMVGIPFTQIDPDTRVEIVLTAPGSTPSFRKMTLEGGIHECVVASVRVGSVESGRDLLERTGRIPGVVFAAEGPETFDAPIEDEQNITIAIHNISNIPICLFGALLGERAS